LLNIRPFKKGFDEDIFVSIFNAVFGDYDDIRSITLEEMKKMEESPSFNTDGMFIAEWKGETAGMVNAYIDKLREEKKGFIQWLGVLPKFRGKEIAKKLVEKALKSLKERGMKVAETWAQTDRKGCLHIFENFGFKQARTTSMMKTNLHFIPSSIGENKEITIREAQLKDDNEICILKQAEQRSFQRTLQLQTKTN